MVGDGGGSYVAWVLVPHPFFWVGGWIVGEKSLGNPPIADLEKIASFCFKKFLYVRTFVGLIWNGI